MQTTQVIIRAMMDEQRRVGARLHKLAQRASERDAELRGLRAQVGQQQDADATVQAEVAAAYERVAFALTGSTVTPDEAYAHDLFAHWTERWQALVDRALELRGRDGALAVCVGCYTIRSMMRVMGAPGAPPACYAAPDGWVEDHSSLFCPACSAPGPAAEA